MDTLIEQIQTGVADNASAEAKQTAGNACRAILAALEATPGETFASRERPPLTLFALDQGQILDHMIGRLRALVPKEDQAASPATPGFQVALLAPIRDEPKGGE